MRGQRSHAGCEEAVTLAHAEWAAAMGDLGAKMADLNEQLELHSVWSSPRQEFHRLLTLGDVSEGMHLYLTASLGGPWLLPHPLSFASA